MSAVAQVANTGSLATPTLRSPSTRRLRPSVAGVADRTALASERVIAELQAKLERVEGENAGLRREVVQLQALPAEASAASKAAIQAQGAMIDSQTAKITALSEELAEVKTTIARLAVVLKDLPPLPHLGLKALGRAATIAVNSARIIKGIN